MNIAMVSCQHFTSGIGNYSFELSRHVREFNPDLKLYKVYKPDHPDASYHTNAWIHPLPYKSFRNLHPYVLPFFLRQGLSKTHADIYHAHWFLSGLALSYLPKIQGVVTMHDVSLLHIKEATQTYENYYRWALNRFKKRKFKLVVVSETAKQDALKYTDYPERLIWVAPNGINQERFFPLRKEPHEKFRIIYSGGLGKRKNLDLLFQAYRLLKEKFIDIELRIAGAYPERTVYPKLVQDMALKDVYFTGYIPDKEMNRFYNSGDLLIYTSRYEGFGFAPLEAMAAGVPVITTTGGSLKEISGGGAICSGYNASEIASLASELILNPNRYDDQVEKGLAWVKQYNWSRAAQQILSLYNHDTV